MCNRLHFKDSAEAKKVQKLLHLLGYYAHIETSGCFYKEGSILEIRDTTFVFANQIIDAFDLVASVEY